MLLSRFWYVALAAIAAFALAGMMIIRSSYERDRSSDSQTLLTGDRHQVSWLLQLDARVRLDNLLQVAANADLTRLITQAGARANDGPALRDISTRVSQQLRVLNSELHEGAGQMLIAVDARGYVIGRTGLNENAGIGDYIGGLPLVARALEGYLRDDTWELQGRVMRMAARPVIDRGRYAGAVIHAREIDDAYVQVISNGLGGATVAFFASGNIYASHPGTGERNRPAPPPSALSELIRTLRTNHEWTTQGVTGVLPVQNGQGSAIYAALRGMVGINGGGFAVARPRPVMPADYLLHAPSDEVKLVPWAKVIGFLLIAAAFGMLFVYLEHDRGSTQLRAMLVELADRKIERLDPMLLRGNARKTALAINEAFERAMREELSRTGGQPRRSVEDLDALLGPTSAQQAQPFADIPPPPPPSALGFPPAPPPRMTPQNPPMPAPAPMGSFGGAPPPPRPAPPGPPMPPRPGSPMRASTAVGLVAPPPPAGMPGPAAPRAADVASTTNGAFANEAEEQAHWREVFDQFVAMKRQCNEDVSTLSYEKFSSTLQRNKEQLVARTQCVAVRFQVYVKDNKATLKASPVK